MTRIAIAAALAALALPLAAEADTVATVSGMIDAFDAPAGFDGSFGVGTAFTGTVTFDEASIFCPDACEVTAASISLGATALSAIDPVADFYTLDTTLSPASLDGLTFLGEAFGLTEVFVAFGIFGAGPNTVTFDSAEGIAFATGTFDVEIVNGAPTVPLPATLPLLLAGLGLGAVWARRGAC